LRLFAYGNGFCDLSSGDIDEAGFGVVFVGDNDGASIGREVEIFRIRTTLDGTNKLVLLDIEDANAIGTLVGRRKLAFVDARSGERRTAQRDVEEAVIGAGMDSARALAQWHRGGHLG